MKSCSQCHWYSINGILKTSIKRGICLFYEEVVDADHICQKFKGLVKPTKKQLSNLWDRELAHQGHNEWLRSLTTTQYKEHINAAQN